MNEREKIAWWLYGWAFGPTSNAEWENVREGLLRAADELLALLSESREDADE